MFLLASRVSCLLGAQLASLFPPGTISDVASSEFGVLQAKTDVFKGRVVQLAGRIVGVEESANGTIILARELPVEKHPVFGPTETNKPIRHRHHHLPFCTRARSTAMRYGSAINSLSLQSPKARKRFQLMAFLALSHMLLRVACTCGKPENTVPMGLKTILM